MAAKQRPNVLVVGGASTDVTMHAQVLPTAGSSALAEHAAVGVGGKGVNQAVAAARLGAQVSLVARVGDDDRGRAVRDLLAREHIDHSDVAVDLEVATGVVVLLIDALEQRRVLFAPGANDELRAEHISALAHRFASADLVLVQLEIPMASASQAVRLARAAGARVVLDCSPAQALSEELLTNLHLVRANAGEAEVLTGVRVVDRDGAMRAAENVLRRGAGAAAIGAPGGNLVLTPEHQLWLPHLSVEVADTTFAGDAFTTALALGLTEGLTWREAGAWASAAAALAATGTGAVPSLPEREQVLAFLERLPANRAAVEPDAGQRPS